MNVGENIRKIRKSKKLTLKDLGKRINLSEQAIGQYERGDREPNIDTLHKIADALGVDLWDLIGSDGDIEINITDEMLEKQNNISNSIKIQNSNHKHLLNWLENTDIEIALFRLLSMNKNLSNLRNNIKALININYITTVDSPLGIDMKRIKLESELETMYIKSLVSTCLLLFTTDETKLLDMINILNKKSN